MLVKTSTPSQPDNDAGEREAPTTLRSPRQRQRRFTSEEAAVVTARYQAGESMNDIARDLQVPPVNRKLH